jgi:hypothetical protein
MPDKILTKEETKRVADQWKRSILAGAKAVQRKAKPK